MITSRLPGLKHTIDSIFRTGRPIVRQDEHPAWFRVVERLLRMHRERALGRAESVKEDAFPYHLSLPPGSAYEDRYVVLHHGGTIWKTGIQQVSSSDQLIQTAQHVVQSHDANDWGRWLHFWTPTEQERIQKTLRGLSEENVKATKSEHMSGLDNEARLLFSMNFGPTGAVLLEHSTTNDRNNRKRSWLYFYRNEEGTWKRTEGVSIGDHRETFPARMKNVLSSNIFTNHVRHIVQRADQPAVAVQSKAETRRDSNLDQADSASADTEEETRKSSGERSLFQNVLKRYEERAGLNPYNRDHVKITKANYGLLRNLEAYSWSLMGPDAKSKRASFADESNLNLKYRVPEQQEQTP